MGIAVLIFKALKKARLQEMNVLSRHRSFLLWFWKSSTKKDNKKRKSYQVIEISSVGFYDLHNENIFFTSTDVSILDKREEKYNDIKTFILHPDGLLNFSCKRSLQWLQLNWEKNRSEYGNKTVIKHISTSICKQWKIRVLLKNEYIFWKNKNKILMWNFLIWCNIG